MSTELDLSIDPVLFLRWMAGPTIDDKYSPQKVSTFPLVEKYTEEDLRMAREEADTTLRESVGRRALLGVEEIVAQVQSTNLALRDGYFALRVLVEAMGPFCDRPTAILLSDTLASWRRASDDNDREEAEQMRQTKPVDIVGTALADIW